MLYIMYAIKLLSFGLFLEKISHPHPYATYQCSMIQFNGEDVSWESFSREQVAAGPFHGNASEHLGGSTRFVVYTHYLPSFQQSNIMQRK